MFQPLRLGKLQFLDATAIMHDFAEGASRQYECTDFTTATWRHLFSLLLDSVQLSIEVNTGMLAMFSGLFQAMGRAVGTNIRRRKGRGAFLPIPKTVLYASVNRDIMSSSMLECDDGKQAFTHTFTMRCSMRFRSTRTCKWFSSPRGRVWRNWRSKNWCIIHLIWCTVLGLCCSFAAGASGKRYHWSFYECRIRTAMIMTCTSGRGVDGEVRFYSYGILSAILSTYTSLCFLYLRCDRGCT